MPEDSALAQLSPAGLTIRPVRPGDFNGLMALLNEGSKSNPAHVPAAIRYKIEGGDPRVFRLVALISGEIIGQTALSFGFAPKPSTGRVTILVRSNQRGRGIAQALLAELLSAANAQLGVTRIETNVFVSNEPAIRLYRHLGFAEESRHLDRDGCEIALMAIRV